jgi:hypothetical protein
MGAFDISQTTLKNELTVRFKYNDDDGLLLRQFALHERKDDYIIYAGSD